MGAHAQILPPDLIWQRNLRLLHRHVRFGWRPNSAKLAALRRLFIGTNSWLRSLEVDYWLEFGTLLGWQREGGIIAHDTDIDFGLPIGAYPVLCAAQHQLPTGFTLHDSSHRHLGPKLYLQAEGWEADFYFHEMRDGKLCTTLRSDIAGDTLPFPSAMVFPLQTVNFLGEDTFVPHQPERLLEHHFGYIGPDAELDRKSGYYRPRTGIE